MTRSVLQWLTVRGGAGRLPGVTLLLAGLALAVFAWPTATALLQWDRTAGDWWRLITCHWTHWSSEHLFWDVLMLAVLGAIAEWRSRREMLACVAGSAVAIGVSAWLWLDTLPTYRGLSGIDSALFVLVVAGALVRSLRTGDRTMAAGAAIGLIAFAAKTVYEVATGHTLFVETAALGVVPVPLAHAVGGVVGLLVVLSRRSATPLRSRSSAPAPGCAPI